MVDRYGGAIEHDLHRLYRLDLVDFFRGRYSWRKLAELLTWSPQGSAFWAARADDDDLADELLALPRKAHGPAPAVGRLSEMTLSNQLLIALTDTLTAVVGRLDALGGVKPNPVRPLKRPDTAARRAEVRKDKAKLGNLVAEAEAAAARGLREGGP